MLIRQWAIEYGVPLHAVVELERRMGVRLDAEPVAAGGVLGSESRQQSLVRLEAAEKDVLCFRNNVGVLRDENGRPVRYGLANDSPKQNEALKSADLIMCRKVLIQPWMIGAYMGQFVSRECKPEGWVYTGSGREPAQLAWANLINSYGGDAGFCTGPGTL